jgi:cbb3-type cytochrome oxidase maturation protein
MESLYLLIPMSLAVIAVIVLILYWAVKSGQFEDLEGPGHSILMDDDVSSDRVVDKSPTPNLLNKKE